MRSSNEAELGLGCVVAVSGQIVEVHFAKKLEKRLYSFKTAPIARVTFSEGAEVVLRTKEVLQIQKSTVRENLYLYQTPKGWIEEKDIVDAKQNSHPLDCFRDGRIWKQKAFEVRKKAIQFKLLYENSNLHGFIGSRVVLTPHQLYAVDKVLKMPHPRALLADEVGLGKTIEAALIFSKLKALGRATRVLILVPEALKHQWLSEMYRKFLELFTLVDEERWEEEKASQGKNSFAANTHVLLSMDLLLKEPEALTAALAEPWDLVIVDEAHQLALLKKEKPDIFQFFWQLSENTKSVLFLTATPYRFGEENFQCLLDLLKTSFEYPVACIHNRREVIKGFPKRILIKHEIKETAKGSAKINWLHTFMQEQTMPKILLIVRSEESAREIYNFFSEKTGFKAALFVESMDLVQRDKQAAWFASPEGARLLVCSEMGSEGRNFQFCHDLILMDLPENPDTLEQRIGRLDRIGQSEDVKLHLPFVPSSPEEFYLKLYTDVYKIFEKPCPFAFRIHDRIDEILKGSSEEKLLAEWQNFRESAQDIYEEEEKHYFSKVQKQIDADSFDPQRAEEILSEITRFEKSARTDDLFEDFMEVFGISHEDFGLKRTIKLGAESGMFAENFPHLGDFEEKAVTFDRGVALLREDIEFVSPEHALFQSSEDYFFDQENGLAGVSFTREVVSRNFVLECFFAHGVSVFVDMQGRVFQPELKIHAMKERKVESKDAQQMHAHYSETLARLIETATKNAAKTYPTAKIDSLHLFIGTASV